MLKRAQPAEAGPMIVHAYDLTGSIAQRIRSRQVAVKLLQFACCKWRRLLAQCSRAIALCTPAPPDPQGTLREAWVPRADASASTHPRRDPAQQAVDDRLREP